MVALVVPNFTGMAPRFADRLLSESQASFCANLKATSGDLRGFHSLRLIEQFAPTGHIYRRAFKFYYPGSDAHEWLLSDDPNSSAVQSPLANDAYNRVYFTDNVSTGLRVTTLGHIATGDPSFAAGVPRPIVAPTVSPAGGSSADIRAYTYVWTNSFGSVGPPAPPTIGVGNPVGTWTISGFETAPTGAAISSVSIYRSQPGNTSSGAYYKVGEIALGVTSFNDAMPADLVPLQPPLDSFNNDPAPLDIQGLVIHSSGAVAGFVNRTVYFSIPYLPHAWPQDFAYTVDDQIVGLAAILNYIVVLTKGYPVVLAGSHPANIAISKLPDPEPCTAFRSIVTTTGAAFFTSPNGLCKVDANGVDRPTNPLITRAEFADYRPDEVIAGSYGSYYVAFYEASRGFTIGLPPYEPISFVPIDRYANVSGIEQDPRTGELFVLLGDSIHLFDSLTDPRFPTTWRSKEFINPQPINLGAVQVLFKTEQDADDLLLIVEAMEDYNATRFEWGPLDTLNGYAVNSNQDAPFPAGAVFDSVLSGLPPIQPIGGAGMYNIDFFLSGERSLRFTLIADGAVKFSTILVNEKTHKMPEGYKATRFYLEVSGAVTVQRLIAAETARECRVA